MARKKKNLPQVDETAIIHAIATRKIEAERARVQELAEENKSLRARASELQQKISLSAARASEAERKLKTALGAREKEYDKELKELESRLRTVIGEQRTRFDEDSVNREKNYDKRFKDLTRDKDGLAVELKKTHSAEIIELKRVHAEEIAKLRDRAEKLLGDGKARHERELEGIQIKGERALAKLDGARDSAEQRLIDLRDSLSREKELRAEADARLKAIDSTVRRIGSRSGQITGFEVDTPEELLKVLAEIKPDAPMQTLRQAVRDLKGAASNVERAFARALKEDSAKSVLHEAGERLGEAMAPPGTDDLPPAPALMVEEAFSIIADEISNRIKGRHYAALIAALANELVRVLRNDRENLASLQRLVEIAEGTELATSARLLLKGAHSHQQEIAASKLLGQELKQVKADVRESHGRVKKLYAVAESGMAGEWAVNALQAMASLKPLPAPDKEAIRRAMYKRVVESAKLIHERIDSSMNLGADAEAALRESDEALTGLEGLSQLAGELTAAVRHGAMTKVEGEKEQRTKIQAARETVAGLGKRGKRVVATFDEQLRTLDTLLGQWKATYRAYTELSRDVDRIVASIEGQTLDISQPLESEPGKRLYEIVHDLSEHLPEFRAIGTMHQRLFFHLANPKQRVSELAAVREQAGRVMKAIGEPEADDDTRNYQLSMARLYDFWAQLEQVRGGTHSQLAVASEQIEPVLGELMVWASSTNVDRLTEHEQQDVLLTLAYVRRLKHLVLGFHDLSKQRRPETGVNLMVDQFEQRLDDMTFPDEWDFVKSRLKATLSSEIEVEPPTELERPG